MLDLICAYINFPNCSSFVCGIAAQTNRSAKLKQCKLDARREQWLSQGIFLSMPSVFFFFLDDDD